MLLQWRNQIWQSLEEGAGKRCSECAQGLDTQSALSDEVWERSVVAGREENEVGGRDMLLKPGSNPQPLDSERSAASGTPRELVYGCQLYTDTFC